jgi:hypothetical protein
MSHLLQIVVRLLALIIGIACVYVALFLYEDEQGKVQSVLEEFWIRISDFRKVAVSRTALFMRELADFTDSTFERFFGRKLLSLKSMAVSACFSSASVCLMILYTMYTNDRMVEAMMVDALRKETSTGVSVIVLNTKFVDEYGPFFAPCIGLIMLFFILLGMLPGFMEKRTSKVWLWSVGVSLLLAASGLFAWEYLGWVKYFTGIQERHGWGHISILWEHMRFDVDPPLLRRTDFFVVMLVAFLIGIATGILSDSVFIAVTRKILRWGSTLEAPSKISGIVALNFFFAFILAWAPAGIGYGIAAMIFGGAHKTSYPASSFSVTVFGEAVQQAGFIASLSNVLTACSASLWVVLGVIALLHRVFWPLLERPVYALQQVGIARRSKLLGSFGLVLLGAGVGVVPSWLKDIVGWMSK